MLDKSDRYIVRQFIMTFLFGVMAFVSIFIIVDLMENLDDFFDRDVPTPVILEFYIYYIPEIVQLIVPVGMLLASLFTIGRLDSTHELTAIRAAGRSMRRVAAPLLSFGIIVSLLMIYMNGWMVPETNKLRFGIDRKYLGRNLLGGQRDVHLRLSPTLNLQMDYFDPKTGEARLVSLERFDMNAPIFTPDPDTSANTDTTGNVDATGRDTLKTIRITERIDAASMQYDSAGREWKLINGIARNFENPRQIVATSFAERELPGLPVTPEELNLSQQNIRELTIDEMLDRIRQEEIGGRDVSRLLVDYYARYAFPFSAFIVIFFGIPFSSAQRKGGAAIPIAVTALVSAIYLVFTEISKTFSYGAEFPPALTAWMANILFLLVGLANLYRVERG